MVGIVVITHSDLGRELIRAAEFILGSLEQAASVGVFAQDEPARIVKELQAAIAQVSGPDGVLVLTDMFGGTPNNISLPLLEPGRVEVVTGVNLPMVIKAATARKDRKLAELASMVCSAGQEAISVAGELLNS